MDRSTVYSQEQGRSTDFLFAQRATMIGLGKVAQAAFGSNTVVRGLAVTPNSPAALNVLVGIGEIYTMAQVDATAWGALPADTTDVIIQQGLNMAPQTLATPAPATSGFSVAYLIEAQFQVVDGSLAVLPFFNSANPQIPLNGQGGNGAPLATQRQGVCVIQVKAGIAATTGTQTTPSVDAGWTPLAVVTVANGQSTVTSGNISVAPGSPQVTSLLQMLQTGSAVYAVDTSAAANTITLALTPPITSYADGQPIRFKAANTNTGAVTLNAGGGAIALTGMNGALQGGEIVALKQYEAIYSAATGTAILIGQTAGPLQVAPATQSQHAVQMAQAAGVVGSTRNLVMSVAAASATATLTADEIIVETALGGIRYCLPNFSKTINLATTGAGGMDTGTAPVSGYVALYAIYNPTTATAALLAQNASTLRTSVYSGANMPAGYTASALVGVWKTNGSSQFIAGYQRDRKVLFPNATAFSTTTANPSPTSLSLAGTVPPNAMEISGFLSLSGSTTGSTSACSLGGDVVASGVTQLGGASTGGVPLQSYFSILIAVAQTAFYTATISSGSLAFTVFISGYTF